MSKQWIVKTSEGRVLGPFSTDEVLKKIRRGEMSGEEQIAIYPGTEWFPISRAPEFYDKLLEYLDQGTRIDVDSNFGVRSKSMASKVTNLEETPRPAREQKNRAQRVSVNHGDEPPKQKRPHSKKVEEDEDDGQVIELKKMKKVVRKVKTKKSAMPIALGGIILLIGVYLVSMGGFEGGDSIRLLSPQKGKTQLSKQQVQSLFSRGLSEFSKGNFSNLVAAQNTFVQVFEGDNKNAQALALLCMAYSELWPYAFQDSTDFTTVTRVTQYASQIDPTGMDGLTCRAVDLLLRGRYEESTNTVDSVLGSYSGEGDRPPTVFYYLKAKLYSTTKNYSAGTTYARSAQQLWPQWLAPFVLEGELLAKQGQMDQAAQRFAAVVKANPSHAEARLQYGLLEIRHFKNYDQGEKLVEAGLSSSERVPREVRADGYLGLAELAMTKGNKSDALSYAKKSYALNSTVEKTKAIILKLGGEKVLRSTKVVDKQLIYEGDQLVREGNCMAAQALYKTAFEANKKNGIAAMKAAECLWKVNLASESIDWLNNAIRADYKLIDAYVLLADYYSQRYNFQAAAQTLTVANSVDNRNYKIFRGFALIELRRLNGKGAVSYAERGLSLYEADVESYVILAKGYMLMDDYPKALTAAGKAIELDVNNRDAQIVYAQSMFGTQGAPAAIDYMSRLVSLYPVVYEYRLALGELYLKNENYDQAATVFQQVIRIEDKPKKALLLLGKVRMVQRSYDKALGAYLKAAAIDPSDAEPLFQAGLLYLNLNKPLEARAQFQRVLRINKEYPLVNYQMGRAALMMNSPKDALEEAKKERLKNPRLADSYVLAAEAYEQLKQYGLCAGEYQKAVKLRPAGADMYVKMARCYRLAGALDAAASMVELANQQESGNPDAWREKGLIYETKGDKAEAIGAYNQYLILAPNAPDGPQVRGKINNLSQ